MQTHEYLTTPEAARYLRVCERSLIRWRGLRIGPPWTRAGRGVRYRRADLDAWLDRRTVDPVGEAVAGLAE